jgi:hypothetical protein
MCQRTQQPCEVRVKAKRSVKLRSVLAFRVRVAIDRVALAAMSVDYLLFEVV